MKAKVEKHMSFPHITYYLCHNQLSQLHKLDVNIQNVVTRPHILIEGLVSKGGTIHVVAFNFIVNLNMSY
jgi:hypothetical protein